MADLKPTGRNLIQNSTGNLGNTSFWGVSSVSLKVVESTSFNGSYLNASGDLSENTSRAFIDNNSLSKNNLVGKTHTISGYFRVNNSNDTNIQLWVRLNSVGTESGANISAKIPADGKWHYLEATKTITKNSTPSYNMLQIAVSQGKAVDLDFRDIKLEIGTEVTPWTPAPEDSLSGGGTNMILAFDVITLAAVTDVQGIYRFYQLATSKPSTPTVYPPAEPWVSTEPEFDMTNQGSLYYIDCTLFNDLTFQYGEVQISSDYEAVKKTYADALQQIANSKQEISAEIQQGDDMLRQEVAETYYSAEDVDTKLGEVSTAFEQTQNYIEMQFESFQADLENLNADNTAQFQQIQKYIRFEDGNIILGESGNELILTIQNDRISFSQGGQEVAYFSNNKLNVTDADVVHTLRIGNFIFSPRPDGSLDFKKAGDD